MWTTALLLTALSDAPRSRSSAAAVSLLRPTPRVIRSSAAAVSLRGARDGTRRVPTTLKASLLLAERRAPGRGHLLRVPLLPQGRQFLHLLGLLRGQVRLLADVVLQVEQL